MSKLASDAPKAQKNLTLSDIPAGWAIGDTILVTRGGNINTASNGEDVAVIAAINGNTITTVSNLKKNHEGRTADELHCYAGNLTRNITFESTNKNQIHQRGHFMAMHNDTNLQVRNTSFKHMGRTDKSRLLDDFVWSNWRNTSIFKSKYSALGQEVVEMQRNPDADITNSRGRYSIHLHKTGATASSNLVYVTGNVVWGNPGWGITQHDSYADVSDNVVYDVTGSGIVSESGSELGFWDDNLVVDIKKGHTESPYTSVLFHDDYLFTGQGLGMKGRGILCRGNVIVNSIQGVGIMNMNPSVTNQDRVDPVALATARTGYEVDNFPLDVNGYSSEGNGVMPVEVALILENTTIIKANIALKSIERDMGVNHESRSIFDEFKAWGVKTGLSITYQADYSFKDVFISGDGSGGTLGAYLWKHSHNHVFENIKLVDLDHGITVSKLVESGDGELKTRNNGVSPWYFINLTTQNVSEFYEITKEDPSTTTSYTEHSDNPIHFNTGDISARPTTFTILDSTELEVDIATGDFRFEVDGIITDDLGSYKMGIKQAEAQGNLRLDYPTRIYEFASQTKFEEYLAISGIYKDANDNDQLYFIINESLPNRRTHQYTSFPVRVKIMNAPNSGIYATAQLEPGYAENNPLQIISRLADVTQSSTQSGLTYDGEEIEPYAEKAIDGNNNGRINCQIFQRGLVPLGSFSQTTDESEPWFDLDLKKEKIISYIDLWNMVELNGSTIEQPLANFGNFYILFSNEPFSETSLSVSRSNANEEIYQPLSGDKRKLSYNDLNITARYVRIQAPGNASLKLAEVEIIGKNSDTSEDVLPLSLLDFTAERFVNSGQKSLLQWITIEERGISHFEIEQGVDKRNFSKIGEVIAQRNSIQQEIYTFIHHDPKIGANYYRLKIVNTDGSFEYSPMRRLDFSEAKGILAAFPNPSSGNLTIILPKQMSATNVEIYDLTGRLVFSLCNIDKESFDISPSLPAGIYSLLVRSHKGQFFVEQIVFE